MIDADAIKEIADNARKPLPIKVGDIEFAAVPDGYNIRSIKNFLDEYKTRPERRKGCISVFDLGSFTALVNRFKNINSAIFQRAAFGENTFSAQLRAVLNYHPAGADNFNADNKDHAVDYAFPLSEQLKTWLAKNFWKIILPTSSSPTMKPSSQTSVKMACRFSQHPQK